MFCLEGVSQQIPNGRVTSSFPKNKITRMYFGLLAAGLRIWKTTQQNENTYPKNIRIRTDAKVGSFNSSNEKCLGSNLRHPDPNPKSVRNRNLLTSMSNLIFLVQGTPNNFQNAFQRPPKINENLILDHTAPFLRSLSLQDPPGSPRTPKQRQQVSQMSKWRLKHLQS